MSARALRLQREEEERKRVAQLQEKQDQRSSEEEEENKGRAQANPLQKARNAFDFLNTIEDEDEGENDEEDGGDIANNDKRALTSRSQTEKTAGDQTPQRQKRKKAKKKKKASKSDPATKVENSNDGLDEIDIALKSLRIKDKDGSVPQEIEGPDPSLQAFYELLKIDSKHLNALNEMKKLFGSTVTDSERASVGASAGRRRGHGQIQLDLGAALAGRYSPVSRGQGLSGLALKRNVLMPGKEEWPKATSGGLGMEIVEKAWDFTTEYKFVHTSTYQGIQRQFDICVESMDPQRMIQMLQLNPYHVSTLLQVSEIAKHQGDHSVSVDLLERALFTFGRSLHSSFHVALSKGKARLDFRRPENREFWLTAYRYISTLGQRGTWRTAFEWAKLLLSLDPEGDPYCMRLIIDQLALRGGQFEHLVKLANTPTSVIDWGQGSPNMLISLSMAFHKLKKPNEAKAALQSTVERFPWILTRLYKELDIESVPKSVWGRQARTDHEELLSAAYVLRAKDIWNTPEALTLLKDTVDSAERVEPPPAVSAEEISLNEARHILLTEMTSLITLLPRAITTSRSSSSDPLPPPDNVSSYSTIETEPDEDAYEQEMQAEEREFQGIRSWFTGMLSRLGVNVNPADVGNDGEEFPIEEVAEALERSGVDINELATRTSRLEELRERQLAAEERLRNLEDDLNTMGAQIREAGTLDESAPAPVVNPRASSVVAEEPTAEVEPPSGQEASGAYSDEANQRWLAGRGMLRLKEFIAQHGSDENAWRDDLDVDVTPATEYAHRVTQLQKRGSKDFILNYALKQGAGAEASNLIKRLLGIS